MTMETCLYATSPASARTRNGPFSIDSDESSGDLRLSTAHT
jgi:hypothetical protein